MSKPIGYVSSGSIPPEVLARRADRPSFEFHCLADRMGAEVMSLCSLEAPGATVAAPRTQTLLDTARLAGKRFALGLWVARRAARYQVIIASGEDIGVPIGLAFRTLRMTTPLIVIVHGSRLCATRFRLLFGMMKSLPNVVFACLSQSLRDLLVSRYGADPARCVGAGYGTDTEFFSPSNRPPERLIASAGSANRDYATLLEAVDGLDIAVKIAADSLWIRKDAAAGLAIPPNVEMRSYGNYANLRDLYDRARFVVVPTHDVPYASGLAVIGEAMAMGKPVVATRGAVVSDFVVENVTGLSVPAGDPAALRAAILRLATDDAVVERMGRAARNLMRTRFSLDAYCERLIALGTQD